MSDLKFEESIENLKQALKLKSKALKDPISYAAIAKCFEVSFEYCWKLFKKRATKEGLEVFSPREAIKAAGRLQIIDDVETWLDDLENRNLSVHDYLGISKKEYLVAIENFVARAERLIKKPKS